MLTRQVAPDIAVLRQRGSRGLAVNVYVLMGAEETALVDAGYPGRAGELLAALEQLGVRGSSVERIFYTHTHIDHMGAAPDWSQLTDLEHVVWHGAVDYVENWDAENGAIMSWGSWLEEIVEDPRLAAVFSTRKATPKVIPRRPLSPIRATREGVSTPAGPYSLEPIFIPGHDPHHVAWWDRSRRVVFTGDAVLAVPTPLCRVMGDDTGQYLSSLARLAELEIDVAYPGHGIPVTHFAPRVERSRQFVEERNQTILDALAGGPMSVCGLAVAEIGEPTRNPTRFSLILANIESSVHYLTQSGLAIRRGNRVQLA